MIERMDAAEVEREDHLRSMTTVGDLIDQAVAASEVPFASVDLEDLDEDEGAAGQRALMVGVPSVAAHMRGIAKVAQRLGLVVKSVAGWETRGRDASLDPHAITCHHTAAPHDSDSILIKGRADLAGPLCNWALHADGTVVAVAAGGGGMPSR